MTNQYNRWSPTTKIFFWLTLLGIILGSIYFFIGQKSNKENFIELQALCAQSKNECSDKNTLRVLEEYSNLNLEFYERGKRAFDGKSFNEARYFYDLLARSNSVIKENEVFWFEYSLILEAQKDYGPEIEAYENAKNALLESYNINPINSDTLYRLAYINERLGINSGNRYYFERALEYCNELLLLDDDALNNILCAANQYFYLDDIDNTKIFVDKALELHPNNIETIISSGLLLYYLDDFYNSYNILDRLDKTQKDKFPDVEKYYRVKIVKSMALKNIGELEESEEKINRACSEMDAIKDEMNFKEFRSDNLDISDIEVTLGGDIMCDGNNLLELLIMIQKIPNVGKCNDPFDEDISSDRC